jgi:hypothetical protein
MCTFFQLGEAEPQDNAASGMVSSWRRGVVALSRVR